ncbi:uncharacterized protein M6B38_396190 [Iris pallida]|uniref:Uncharacterized protein n=1 Tax=Iris pallida TaxID=29817 RepID=A0AAX6FW90_IRIPA|nr:uncharacterized protein M6B38_396190 [Iris pallida]
MTTTSTVIITKAKHTRPSLVARPLLSRQPYHPQPSISTYEHHQRQSQPPAAARSPILPPRRSHQTTTHQKEKKGGRDPLPDPPPPATHRLEKSPIIQRLRPAQIQGRSVLYARSVPLCHLRRPHDELASNPAAAMANTRSVITLVSRRWICSDLPWWLPLARPESSPCAPTYHRWLFPAPSVI